MDRIEWERCINLLWHGKLELPEPEDNGLSQFSAAWLPDLRRYITALEHGYREQAKMLRLYKSMVERCCAWLCGHGHAGREDSPRSGRPGPGCDDGGHGEMQSGRGQELRTRAARGGRLGRRDGRRRGRWDGRPLFRPMLGHLPPRGKDLDGRRRDGRRRAVGDRPYGDAGRRNAARGRSVRGVRAGGRQLE